jgi:heme/copper-type cytochrome/quinol oxidase subunit 2
MVTDRVSAKRRRFNQQMRNWAAIIWVAIGSVATTAIFLNGHAMANDTAATIKFENHHWTPLNVTVPANQALTIEVVNASDETIEFESFKLNRETAMTPGQTIKVPLPALSPGSYDFYDDFHQDVPQGTIVAK